MRPSSVPCNRGAGALSSEVRAVSGLPAPLRASMFELYARYYANAAADRFERDLAGKDQVVLMWDGERNLQGFSTVVTVHTSDPQGQPVRAIFSGDTIVDHRHWGQQTLAFTWIRLAGRIAAAENTSRLYWFLIVKGHRTYRYLHAFTKRYFPHWCLPTPAMEQALMDRLAGARFGDDYEASSGLVRFASSHGHLRPRWAQVEAADRCRPEVGFFLRRNPGYVNGDELVCLSALDLDNLRPLARRLFEQGMQS